MSAPDIIVCVYDATEPDIELIRSWLDLPKLEMKSGRIRVRFPPGCLCKDGKTSALDAYCEFLRVLNLRYDYSEQKK